MSQETGSSKNNRPVTLSSHTKRLLTAFILLPVIVYLIGFAPRILFCFVLLIVSLAALHEFHSITSLDSQRVLCLSNFLLAISLFWVLYLRLVYFVPAVITLWAFIPLTVAVLYVPHPDEKYTCKVASSVLGLVYICLPLSMLMMIDWHPHGRLWIFFLFFIIVASDTGAFYMGRLFGKHALNRTVSPKKTWEGALGGILFSLLACFLFTSFFAPSWYSPLLFVLAFVLSVTEQAGDLAESLLKRNAGVKDSGSLLPGHGGILDRIDGLLFSVPVGYVFIFFMNR